MTTKRWKHLLPFRATTVPVASPLTEEIVALNDLIMTIRQRLQEKSPRTTEDVGTLLLDFKLRFQKLNEKCQRFIQENPSATSVARIHSNAQAVLKRKFADVTDKYKKLKEIDCAPGVFTTLPDVASCVVPTASTDVRSTASTDGHSQLAQEQEREREVRELENSLVNLHHLFEEVSAINNIQGELLDRVELSISAANDATARAGVELERAAGYKKRSRRKMLYLVGGAIVVILIAGLLLYSE